MSNDQFESMLTARQVADFLQVSISTIRRWSDRGMLKFYRIGSRGDRRYRRHDVLSFLHESTGHPRTDVSGEKELARLTTAGSPAPSPKTGRGDNKPARAR